MRGVQWYSQILEEDCVKEQVVIVERVGRVGVITLNRPKVLNALNDELMNELGAALLAFDADDEIGTIVIAGSPRAFAAGADVSAMADWSYRMSIGPISSPGTGKRSDTSGSP